MRRVLGLFLFIAISIGSVSGQDIYNRWSIDGDLGWCQGIGPYAEGYSTNYLNLFHFSGGARYMFTNKIGVAADLGFDRITNDHSGGHQGGPEFTSHFFRTGAHLVFNVGRIIEVNQVVEDLGLLFHVGGGWASLKPAYNSVWFHNWKTQGTDEMFSWLVGFTPQYRINDRVAVNMDLSYTLNAWQSMTFDFSEQNFQPGLHGRIFSMSFGMSYYLGDKEKHQDWVVLENGTSTYFGADTVIKKKTVRTVETIKIRGQQPGGPDPNKTKADSINQERQPEADFDGDGIPNSIDQCPTEKGDSPNGCPSNDRDRDGVANDIDECPDLAGDMSNHGCPPIDLKVKMILNDAMINTDFEKDRDVLLEESYVYLDKVVEVLNSHPEYNMQIHGHTDNLGEKGPLLALSKARAKKVLDYLVSKGIEESRLTSDGHGGEDPLTSNESPSGRKQNERIEFVIKFN